MEEGSLRVDANVSVRRSPEDPFGTRCEIKNLNSLRSLGRAIEYEAKRQIDLLEAGEVVRQETRHWDETDGRTHTMRVKEEADDYRYFPEPDLVPLDPDREWIERVRAEMPMLPAERRARLAEAAGVELPHDGVTIIVERGQDDQALAAIEAGGDPARVLVHIEQNLAGDGGADLDPSRLAALVGLETSGKLTPTQAKEVLAEMLTSDAKPDEIAAAKGFEAMDTGDLTALVDGIIDGHPDEWAQLAAAHASGDAKAKKKLSGFFTGQVMRQSQGKANGKLVAERLEERLKN
jgi:aspartyl-tRNA(Asn)/glutamyl-tRNA(Gln) amidotransferase subunit B